MGVLVRRVLEGYEEVAQWSSEDPSSLEAAQRQLQEGIEAGYMAVRDDGDDMQPVTELPPDAERVVLTMPAGGG